MELLHALALGSIIAVICAMVVNLTLTPALLFTFSRFFANGVAGRAAGTRTTPNKGTLTSTQRPWTSIQGEDDVAPLIDGGGALARDPLADSHAEVLHANVAAAAAAAVRNSSISGGGGGGGVMSEDCDMYGDADFGTEEAHFTSAEELHTGVRQSPTASEHEEHIVGNEDADNDDGKSAQGRSRGSLRLYRSDAAASAALDKQKNSTASEGDDEYDSLDWTARQVRKKNLHSLFFYINQT
jgi:hypothetical protein